MPLDGEKLDELLSGYIDGRLDADELRQVEEALRARKEVRQQLDDLITARESLIELSRVKSGRLSDDFTQRVMAATSESRTARHAAEPSFVDTPNRTVALERRWRVRHIALLVASLAAGLLVVINLPSLLESDSGAPIAEKQSEEPSDDDATSQSPLLAQQLPVTPGAATEDMGPTLPVSYLGDIEAPILFAYVMHVRPTASAYRSGVIESLLQQAGIRAVAPIVANSLVEEALRDTSMIVLPNEVHDASAIYFIRGESTAIDRAFGLIWRDTASFPDAHYNLAMDNPQTRLMSKIAQSTGKRFAVNDSFAAPIAVVNEAGATESTVAGLQQPVYVSAAKRGDDFGSAAGLSPPTVEMSTVMIVVHVPSDL